MGDQLKRIVGRIERKYKLTFVASLICGLCTHLYQFTNKIPNYDEYGQTPAGIGATLGLGRWGLELAARIYGFFFGWFSFPMVNGLVALFFIALSACFIVAAYDVKDRFICMLIGGIAVVFPAVVSAYFFMFTAHYYAMALCCTCAAACLLTRCELKPERQSIIRFLSAVMLVCFSTGIYQAYVSVFISMLLIDVIVRCYADKEKVRTVIRRGIVYLSGIMLGLLFYLGIMKMVNSLYEVEMSGYHNMNNMMQYSFGKLIYGFLSCYRALLGLMTGEDILALNYSAAMKIIYGVMICIITAVPIINAFDKTKSTLSRVLMLCGTLILPVAFFFVFILAGFGDGAVYTLMVYSVLFVLVYPLILCDRFEDGQKGIFVRFQKIVSWLCAVSAAMCIVIYFWYANANYQGLQYTHYHDMAYFQTLMTQVKSLQGYDGEMPVAILGEFDDPTNKAGSLMDYHFHIGGKWDTNINYKNRVMLWFCYLGFTPEVIEDKESLLKISQKPEVKEMPTYPNAGSMAIVDGIVVIKANETMESYSLY